MKENLLEQSVQCLYCQKEFQTKKVRQSKISVKKVDGDFCNHFRGENPYFYEVKVCPFCGFAFTRQFSPVSPARKEHLEKEYISKVEVPRVCGERTWEDALRSFKLALFCGNLLHEKKYLLANLCLKIAWLYRYEGDEEEEKRFLINALELYLDIYEGKVIDDASINPNVLVYLIGELNGRLGYYEETRTWFSYLLTDNSVEPRVKKWTKNRWAEYRRKRKEDVDFFRDNDKKSLQGK